MKIIIGADHGGFELKEKLSKYLSEKDSMELTDVGIYSEESVDYPDVVKRASDEYFNKKADLLILLCGTGIGVSIAANKIEGIYCALLHDNRTARLARSHNNANCIALGGRETTYDVAIDILDTFLNTSPSTEDRHKRRRDKVCSIEKSCFNEG